MTSLDEIRKKIEEIDTALLTLVALRMEQSKLVKQYKKGQSVQDAARELHLQKKWHAEAKNLGIDPAFALEILALILIESRSVQAHEEE